MTQKNKPDFMLVLVFIFGLGVLTTGFAQMTLSKSSAELATVTNNATPTVNQSNTKTQRTL
ncbi:hypothetical protein H0A36_08865 [Endozoicomonas sp. SM1973]|uniref:Uncharacterized protein n=1 Tax=Spartinivicinus marinus TaxID=2994442 RepID=A0A853HY46_9GAMM|nr:hypothetical protein [Spartinivicinus marinus]MCX4027155.1 hypothetical protein [Spartinivicinus marinus]NYZ66123.1 hypothetical protein [Spartinivicinus marinus]